MSMLDVYEAELSDGDGIGDLEQTMNWLEYHDAPAQLHSGGWSHWLVRGDLMFEDEAIRNAVLDYWVGLLGNFPIVVVSVPTGGDRWAEALRGQLGPQRDVLSRRVVVDDVVTTGASILGTDPGVHVRLAVVDRRVSRRQLRVDAWARIPLPLCEAPR